MMRLSTKITLSALTVMILACGGGGGASNPNPYAGTYSGTVEYFNPGNTGSASDNSGTGTGSISADGTLRFETPLFGTVPDVIEATVDNLGTLTSARLTFVNGSGSTVTLNGTGSVTVAGSQTRVTTQFPQISGPPAARRYLFLVNKI